MKLAQRINRKIGKNEVSMYTWPSFQSHIILIHLVLQVSSPRSRPRWRLVCRRFTGECQWGWQLWKRQGKEAEWEEREAGLHCSHNKASADPQAELKLGQPWRVTPSWGIFYTPASTSHWTQAAPGRGHDLEKGSCPQPGQFPAVGRISSSVPKGLYRTAPTIINFIKRKQNH